jgi:hypothetical protein
MQRKNVIRPARPCWLAGASVLAGALLVSACGSSTPPASSAASASAAVPSIAPSTAAATPPPEPTPSAAVTPSMPVNPGGTDASTQSCTYRAAHDVYLYITKADAAANGALTLTGQAAKLVCGGADDFHWNTVTATQTAHAVPTVSIQVFPVTKMSPQSIQPSQLAAYLKTDSDTKIFLVGGPLSAITSLQEQFHP